MKIDIAFRNLNNEDLFSAKSFTFHMANFPRVDENVMLMYNQEDDESYFETQDALNTFKTDTFLVTEVFHYSAVSKEHDKAGLLFVIGEVRD